MRHRDAEIVNRVALTRLCSGSKHDSGICGGRQYAPLLALRVPG
jgi:hypothetical protein